MEISQTKKFLSIANVSNTKILHRLCLNYVFLIYNNLII